jgi:hypothetical protein
MKWCCALHNEVNVMTRKPTFPCSTAELDIRWKDGRAECWEVKSDDVDSNV